MCGRFVSSSRPDKIAEFFGASCDGGEGPDGDGPGGAAAQGERLESSFNVAPTNDVYAVVARADGHRELTTYRWGLVPSWAKDVKIGSKMINARGETLAEKPAFKGLFRKHRLLVPMDGFYEWQVQASAEGEVAGSKPRKTPMFIHRTDGQQLAVAGLWAAWKEPGSPADAPWLHTCTVITTAANATMAPVHDRMPVLLAPDAWERWLDPGFHDMVALQSLLVPAPDNVLTMHAVSTAVNSVRNKGAELVAPVSTDAGARGTDRDPGGGEGRLF